MTRHSNMSGAANAACSTAGAPRPFLVPLAIQEGE